MITTFKRCKHCHKTYVYYLSGNWIPPFNNENYCPECQKAIEEALSKIPVKYRGKYQEIPNPDQSLIDRMDEMIYESNMADAESFFSLRLASIGESGLGCDSDLFIIDNKKYAYIHNKDQMHVYIYNEYDIENQCFTGNYYDEYVNNSNSYHHDIALHFDKFDNIEPSQLPPPSGELFYMDCLGFTPDTDTSLNMHREAFEQLCNEVVDNKNTDIDFMKEISLSIDSSKQNDISTALQNLTNDLIQNNKPLDGDISKFIDDNFFDFL